MDLNEQLRYRTNTMENSSLTSSSSPPSSVMKEKKFRFKDDTEINSEKQNDTTDLEETCFDHLEVGDDAYLDEESSGYEICSDDVACQCQKFHVLVLRAKYISALTADYYRKKNFWLIFLPLQILAIWTTISGILFSIQVTGNDSSNHDNGTTNGNNDIVISNAMLTAKALLDGLVGSALLIITNISKVLDYSGKTNHYELIEKQMQNLDKKMEMLANNYEKDDATKLAEVKEASAKYMEIIGNNEKYSPPTQITLAYDHIAFELNLRLSTIATSQSSTMKIGYHNNIVIEADTRDLIERKAYSDLAFFIENSTKYGFISLPNPRKVSNEVMKNIEKLLAKYEDDAENSVTFKKKLTKMGKRFTR